MSDTPPEITGALALIQANPEDKRAAEDRVFNWEISPQEKELIASIIQRAQQDLAFIGFRFDATLAAADIITVHNMCGGLKLLQWLMAERTEFLYDFVGIARHLDRRAGVLLEEFKPIFHLGKGH